MGSYLSEMKNGKLVIVILRLYTELINKKQDFKKWVFNDDKSS